MIKNLFHKKDEFDLSNSVYSDPIAKDAALGLRVSRLYSPCDEKGTRHLMAFAYEYTLSDEDADKMGAYHDASTKGVVRYMDYKDGTKPAVEIGVAANESGICSYSDLNKSKYEFTKNQVNYACSYIQNAMTQYTKSEFELSEDVIEDTAFAVDKPCASADGYMMFYTGPGYDGVTKEAVEHYVRDHAFEPAGVYWATESPRYEHFYNGDTFVAYESLDKLPDDMRHDAEMELAREENRKQMAYSMKKDHETERETFDVGEDNVSEKQFGE